MNISSKNDFGIAVAKKQPKAGIE